MPLEVLRIRSARADGHSQLFAQRRVAEVVLGHAIREHVGLETGRHVDPKPAVDREKARVERGVMDRTGRDAVARIEALAGARAVAPWLDVGREQELHGAEGSRCEAAETAVMVEATEHLPREAVLAEAHALLDDPLRIALGQAEIAFELSDVRGALAQRPAHLDRAEFVLPQEIRLVAVGCRENVRHALGTEALATSGIEHDGVDACEHPGRRREPCEHFRFEPAAVGLGSIEVEHLVVQRGRTAAEGSGELQHFRRREVDVPPTEAVRIQQEEKGLAEDDLDRQERLLSLARTRKVPSRDLSPLLRGSGGRDVEKVAESRHAVRLHRGREARWDTGPKRTMIQIGLHATCRVQTP